MLGSGTMSRVSPAVSLLDKAPCFRTSELAAATTSPTGLPSAISYCRLGFMFGPRNIGKGLTKKPTTL